MRRTWHVWIAFGLCLAVVLAAMGWISLKAVRLERAEIAARWRADKARRHEAQARREAALEQDVQLALYRMEFSATPLVAQESARPYSVYHTFPPGAGPYDPDAQPPGGPTVSPLLKEVSPDVLVYFQFEPDGRLTSPHVPEPARRPLVVPRHISRAAVEQAEKQLSRVAAIVDRETLLAMLPGDGAEPAQVVPLAAGDEQRRMNFEYQQAFAQQGRDVAEYSRRSQAVQQSANVAAMNAMMSQRPDTAPSSPQTGGVLMKPLWLDGQLILARRVRVGKLEYVQGCLLNWPSIKEGLLMTIEDLLPHADLQPVAAWPRCRFGWSWRSEAEESLLGGDRTPADHRRPARPTASCRRSGCRCWWPGVVCYWRRWRWPCWWPG
jgi:hypothetical protein